jgi:hypothetical protein
MALDRTSVVLDHESLLPEMKIEDAKVHCLEWACSGIHLPLCSMMYVPNTTYEMIREL